MENLLASLDFHELLVILSCVFLSCLCWYLLLIVQASVYGWLIEFRVLLTSLRQLLLCFLNVSILSPSTFLASGLLRVIYLFLRNQFSMMRTAARCPAVSLILFLLYDLSDLCFFVHMVAILASISPLILKSCFFSVKMRFNKPLSTA